MLKSLNHFFFFFFFLPFFPFFFFGGFLLSKISFLVAAISGLFILDRET
jgi:hypothetical protein